MPPNRDDKTEPATPRRLEEARNKGQVARSQDLPAAVLLLAGFLALWFFGPRIWFALLSITAASLTLDGPVTGDDILPFAGAAATEALRHLGPFLVVLFLSMLVSLLAQVGWLLTFDPLIPRLSKLNPIEGLKRLFSIRSIMLAVTNFGKLLVVGTVAYLTLLGTASAIIFAFSLDHNDLFTLGSSLMFDLGIRLGVALFVLALLDVAWQRFRHAQDMKMSKEEIKDEFRNMEGDPVVKRRRKEVQFQMAMQQLRSDVPEADVIVTNPTHVSVAIKYDAETMMAPKVVAKGADYMALRIRQLASEFGIPIVQRPPLARTMFETVEVGEYIPEQLYKAIAEILAYVYELTGQSNAPSPAPAAG